MFKEERGGGGRGGGGGHNILTVYVSSITTCNSLVYWGLTPQQYPWSYRSAEMMMMWRRKPPTCDK